MLPHCPAGSDDISKACQPASQRPMGRRGGSRLLVMRLCLFVLLCGSCFCSLSYAKRTPRPTPTVKKPPPVSQQQSPAPASYPALPLRAVCLGGWLVTEGWILPSLFDGIPNKDLLVRTLTVRSVRLCLPSSNCLMTCVLCECISVRHLHHPIYDLPILYMCRMARRCSSSRRCGRRTSLRTRAAAARWWPTGRKPPTGRRSRSVRPRPATMLPL